MFSLSVYILLEYTIKEQSIFLDYHLLLRLYKSKLYAERCMDGCVDGCTEGCREWCTEGCTEGCVEGCVEDQIDIFNFIF